MAAAQRERVLAIVRGPTTKSFRLESQAENLEEVVICQQCPVLFVRFNLSHRHHHIQLC